MLLISRIYSCSLSGSAYGPTEAAPRLLARREHSSIGLYYHIHQGPPSNGPTRRCRHRICEFAQPTILSDFRASNRRDPRRLGPRPDRERPGRLPRREAPLSLFLQQAEGCCRVAEDWSHGNDAGLTEAPQRPVRGWRPRLGCGKARGPRRHTQKEPRCPCRGRLQQHVRGFHPTHTHALRPSTDKEKIAELVRLGTINSKNLWILCGATGFNSEVVMKAQAAILAKADSDAAASRMRPLWNSRRLRWPRRLRRSGVATSATTPCTGPT